MSLISIPFTFSSGAVIIAAQHNSNFTAIFSDYNGSVNNDNIAVDAAIAYTKLELTDTIVNTDINSSAAIAYSKLALSNSILNADINASAAIVDTKLAQLTTASKVALSAIAATGTPGTTTFLRGDGSWNVAGLSNVLFSFCGQNSAAAGGGGKAGLVTGTDFVQTVAAHSYTYWAGYVANSGTYQQIMDIFKWVKIAGVSTVTIYAKIWQNRDVAGAVGTLKVDIGGANGSVGCTARQLTPEAVSFTINVSGLTNGSAYDVTISVDHNVNAYYTYLSSIIAVGS